MTVVRPRVFVSSVITGFEAFREAAGSGIADAGAEPVMVERFPSLDISSRNACLEGVRSSDAVTMIVGPSAGSMTPSGRYVIEEEWQYARKRGIPLHVFIQDTDLSPDAQRIANELSDYVHGRFRVTFRTPDELRQQVARSISGSSIGMSSVTDPAAIMLAVAGNAHRGYDTRVRLAIQPLRDAELIDPLDLEERPFQDKLLYAGTRGPVPLFSLRAKKVVNASASGVRLEQPGESGRDTETWFAVAEVTLRGFLVAECEVGSRGQTPAGDAYGLGLALSMADLRNTVSSLVGYASSLFNELDPFVAFRDFRYNVALVNLGHRYVYDSAPAAGRGIPVRMADNSNLVAFESARPIVREALDEPVEEVRRVVALLRQKASAGV